MGLTREKKTHPETEKRKGAEMLTQRGMIQSRFRNKREIRNRERKRSKFPKYWFLRGEKVILGKAGDLGSEEDGEKNGVD